MQVDLTAIRREGVPSPESSEGCLGEVLGTSASAEAEAPDQQGLQGGNIRPDYTTT